MTDAAGKLLDAPLLEALAAERRVTDEQRRLSDRAFAALSRRRLFRLAFPRELGGAETPPWRLIETIRELARRCPSSAWCVGVAYAHSWLVLTYFEEHIAEEILAAAGGPPVAGVLARRGRFSAGPGGMILNGNWPYCSASVHSDWVLMGAQGDGCAHRLFLVPTSAIRIEHNWRGPGLLGTGSHNVDARDVRVSMDRSIDWAACRPLRPEPLYQAPRGLILNWALVGAGLGLADSLGIDVSADSLKIKEDCCKAAEAGGGLPAEEIERMKRRIAEPIRRAAAAAGALGENAREPQTIRDLLTLSTHIAFR